MNQPKVGAGDAATAFAVRLREGLDHDGFSPDWSHAIPFAFDTDWQGSNPDPQRATEVRLLWTPERIFLRFTARYRSLTVFADADPSGRRDDLWDRDVCEAFLQADPSRARNYAEFEISPNGLWIDIAIDADRLENKPNLRSGLRRRAVVDEKTRTWTGELVIPMRSLTQSFDPARPWRANFFRVEGASEPRFYSCWRPTGTKQPNFHVTEAFGRLVFL